MALGLGRGGGGKEEKCFEGFVERRRIRRGE
jgi:hypothetical protein